MSVVFLHIGDFTFIIFRPHISMRKENYQLVHTNAFLSPKFAMFQFQIQIEGVRKSKKSQNDRISYPGFFLTLFCILLPKCNKAADLFSATHTTIHLTNIASSSHVNKFRAVKLQSDWFRNPKNQQSRHLCVCSLNVTLCKVAYFLILPAVCTQKNEKMILISA